MIYTGGVKTLMFVDFTPSFNSISSPPILAKADTPPQCLRLKMTEITSSKPDIINPFEEILTDCQHDPVLLFIPPQLPIITPRI